MNIYGVLDVKAQVIKQVFSMDNDVEAERDFATTALKKESIFNQWPDDWALGQLTMYNITDELDLDNFNIMCTAREIITSTEQMIEIREANKEVFQEETKMQQLQDKIKELEKDKDYLTEQRNDARRELNRNVDMRARLSDFN